MLLHQAPKTILSLVAIFSVIAMLGGCASIAEGITRALMDNSNDPIPRKCTISGPAFSGIEGRLDAASDDLSAKTIRVILIHGIGTHEPGWSTPQQLRLAAELGLNSLDKNGKRIQLESEKFPGETLGTLSILRLFDKSSGTELISYELVWSDITQQWKRNLAYDTTGHYSDQRAAFNQDLKLFLNDRLLDPVAYIGNANGRIRAAAAEVICFSAMPDWSALPASGVSSCDLDAGVDLEALQQDQLVFITHSLGSRIIADTLQTEIAEIRERLTDKALSVEQRATFVEFIQALQEKEVSLYMMANQLPLMDAAMPPARVVNQLAAYCESDGMNFNERIFTKLSVVAFSDPNDPLSYGLPANYASDFLDSRLCPSVINVSLNVTDVVNPLGLLEIAPPLESHTGYAQDDIVLGLMVGGVGTETMVEPVAERCTWINVE
jgi:hypothetical protein